MLQKHHELCRCLCCSSATNHTKFHADVPCSPIRKSSYASQVTTPPASRLQHHFITLLNTCFHLAFSCYRVHHAMYTIGSVSKSSCSRRSPFILAPRSMLKKLRMNVRAALGSDAGRNGNNKKGRSSAGEEKQGLVCNPTCLYFCGDHTS